MQTAVEIEEGAAAETQTANHLKSARPVYSGRRGSVSADSFRQLTARLKKHAGAPLQEADPASSGLDMRTSRLATASLIAPEPPLPLEPETSFAPPALPAEGFATEAPLAEPVPEEPIPTGAARDIVDAILAAPVDRPSAGFDTADQVEADREAELDRIRAAIFAPLGEGDPVHEPELPSEPPFAPLAGPEPEPAAASEAIDARWPPAPSPGSAAEALPPWPPLPEFGAIAPSSDAPVAHVGEEWQRAPEPAALVPADDVASPEPPADSWHGDAVADASDAVLRGEPLGGDAWPDEDMSSAAGFVPGTLPSAGAAATEAYALSPPTATSGAESFPSVGFSLDVPSEPPAAPDATAAPDLPDAEPAADAGALTPLEGEAQQLPPAEAAAEPASPVTGEQSEFVPIPLPGEDNAGQPASLAGKVVDAMLKTISTAIYAKPTASERAAFLREMAELMEQAAAQPQDDGGGEAAPARLVVEPLVPAALAAVATGPFAEAPQPEFDGPRPQAEPDAEPQPIAAVLAERIGAVSPILKLKPQAPDPFAQHTPRALIEKPPEETLEADDESGELALTLLDMMSGGTGSLPHERTLAADTLLRILPRIPVKQLLSVVDRVAIMSSPPALLVAKLIRDTRPEVVGPLLERCSQISDQDLMNACAGGDTAKLRMIARRRVLSTVLSDYLISTQDPAVLLTLIRNPGAALSHEAFFRLSEAASHHAALLAPLATRSDLPPPVAFELFWHVPPELRRFIFSRFLTDSENLNRILRITLATYGGPGESGPAEGRFPPRETLESAVHAAAGFRLEEAAQSFSEMAGVSQDTVLRIFSDRDGEPFTVMMKMLGCQRSKFGELCELLRNCDPPLLRADRKADDLQAIFDSLSFNKARILMTYWDWSVRKAGPYAENA